MERSNQNVQQSFSQRMYGTTDDYYICVNTYLVIVDDSGCGINSESDVNKSIATTNKVRTLTMKNSSDLINDKANNAIANKIYIHCSLRRHKYEIPKRIILERGSLHLFIFPRTTTTTPAANNHNDAQLSDINCEFDTCYAAAFIEFLLDLIIPPRLMSNTTMATTTTTSDWEFVPKGDCVDLICKYVETCIRVTQRVLLEKKDLEKRHERCRR